MSPIGADSASVRFERLDPEALPSLTAFLGGVLHQDWMLDYASPAEAAYWFLSEAEPDAAAALAAEWAVLATAARGATVDELNAILRSRFRSGWHATSLAEVDAVSAELERALRFSYDEPGD